jgi:hypothetical protein
LLEELAAEWRVVVTQPPEAADRAASNSNAKNGLRAGKGMALKLLDGSKPDGRFGLPVPVC